MSRFFYAQINEANTVIAVSDLSGPVEANNMISIQVLDNFLIGKVWDGKKFVGESIIIDQPVVFSVPSQYFRNRFTNEELYKLYGSQDIQIKIWLDDLRLKLRVDVDENLEQVFAKLVQLGILTQNRSDQIMQEYHSYAG